jgi:chromosome segregation ATPase
LGWIFTNSPNGDWMRRLSDDGSRETATVKIITDDYVVSRVKGKDKNQYKIEDQSYNNFGFNVPEPVKDIMGEFQTTFNKKEFCINLHGQEDQPFMVFESATTRSAMIDQLTGLDLVEKTISNVTKKCKNTNAEIKLNTRLLDETREELKGMPNTKKLMEEMLDAKEQYNCTQKLKQIVDMYTNLREETREVNTTTKKLAPYIEHFGAVQNKYNKLSKLKNKLLAFEEIDEDVSAFNSTAKPKGNLEHTEKLMEDYNALISKRDEMSRLQEEMETATSSIQASQTMTVLRKEELDKYENAICKECGKPYGLESSTHN